MARVQPNGYSPLVISSQVRGNHPLTSTTRFVELSVYRHTFPPVPTFAMTALAMVPPVL